MQPVDVTFLRALKIWWSYTWRTMVLWLPLGLGLPIGIIMFWAMPHRLPALLAGPRAEYLKYAVWPLFIAPIVILQIYAIRWTLKARWSDFRLLAVTEDQAASPR